MLERRRRRPRRTIPASRCSATDPEAAAYPTRCLLGQVVQLEDDVERHDIYGRRLAYVYLDGANFERELLQKGYAHLLVIEPNHAHAREMLDDELDARTRRVGLWRACART
jgi:micrococcal nuclease